MFETLTQRKASRRRSLLEEMKPFSTLKNLELLAGSKEKLPILKAPDTPTRSNFFPKLSRNSSKEELKADSPMIPRRSQITPIKLSQVLPHSNIVRRVAFKTRVGSVLSKPKLHNQDAYIIKPSLQGQRGNYLFAVCDGHGAYGHYVSQYIHDSFPSIIEEHLNPSHIQLEKGIHQSITKLSKGLQETGIEIAFSGSTLISVIILGSLCICANVGDSRAVLGRLTEGQWEALGLSNDHTTKRLDERTRILNSNGRICQSKNREGEFVGPERVWLPDDEYPGLAMTRSIGDKVSKAVGVISDPEVITKRLGNDDKFIVLASDGIWEYISNDDAVNIIKKFWKAGEVEEAAHAIVTEAHKKWKKEEYVDDITVIVIFLSVTED